MINQPKKINGALFEGTNPNGPAFSGFIDIHEDIPAGTKLYVACWPRTSKKGDAYLNVDEDVRRTQQAQQALPQAQPQRPTMSSTGLRRFQPRTNLNITTGPQGGGGRPQRDMDDDIPFGIS